MWWSRGKVDKTKPLPAPEGYSWHVRDSPLAGARFVIELLPTELMHEKRGGMWWYRQWGNPNFKNGALLPLRSDGQAYFNWPKEIRYASKKALKLHMQNVAERRIKKEVVGLFDDNT